MIKQVSKAQIYLIINKLNMKVKNLIHNHDLLNYLELNINKNLKIYSLKKKSSFSNH